MDDPRQHRIGLAIAPRCIVDLITGIHVPEKSALSVVGWSTPLPEDVKFAGVFYDYPRDMFVLMVQHPSFDVVPLGEILPIHHATFQTMYPIPEDE